MAVVADPTVNPELPADMPSPSMPTFQVTDAAAAAAAVAAGGGVVHMGPMASPYGEFVVAADPPGAGSAVMVPIQRQERRGWTSTREPAHVVGRVPAGR